MADRPIIFSAPMVRALLDGRKTQTRRVLNSQPVHDAVFVTLSGDGRWIASDTLGYGYLVNVPYAPGDRLWVREAFVTGFDLDENDMPKGDRKVWYRATDAGLRWLDSDADTILDNPPWKPSIHMPRWASRLTLTVTDVRVQRLQDISEEDAVAEGCDAVLALTMQRANGGFPGNPRAAFQDLWNSLHGPDAWDANPWVAAITFIVQRRNIDEARK